VLNEREKSMFLIRMVFAAAISERGFLNTFSRLIWIAIENDFSLKSFNGSLIKLSNTQASVFLHNASYNVTDQAVIAIYTQQVHDFILNSTSEDRFQLSLELLPGAIEFASEVRNYSRAQWLQHLG
jgi:hypothetical protein